jgi:hypothetical protein
VRLARGRSPEKGWGGLVCQAAHATARGRTKGRENPSRRHTKTQPCLPPLTLDGLRLGVRAPPLPWFPQGPVAQSTDTHWACRDGGPAWNYRVVIPLTLPLKDPLQARLGVQLWDYDILTANDLVAERSLDLYPWLLMAYHR